MRRDLFIRYGQWVSAGAWIALAVVWWGALITDAYSWRIARAVGSLAGGLVIGAYGVLQGSDWQGATREFVERDRSRSISVDGVDRDRSIRMLRTVGWLLAASGLILTVSGVLLVFDLVAP